MKSGARFIHAFLVHEWRLQRRSLRFLSFAAGFVALASLPAVAVYVRWPASPAYLGPATFAAETLAVLPLLVAVLGFAVGADALQRERDEGSWPALALAPVSNAGYLLSRWLAVQTLLLPLVAVPVAVAAGMAWIRCGDVAVAPFAAPLFLQVFPVAVFASALGLGLGTVARGVLGGAVLAGLYLVTLDGLLGRLPGGLHLSLGGLDPFLNLLRGRWTLLGLQGALRGEGLGATRYPVPASEAPFDPWVAGEQYLAQGLVVGGACLLALVPGILYMGRTQRDLRPWTVAPDHPLRSFLSLLNTLRIRYSRDGGLGRTDLLVVGLGVLLFASTLAVQAHRTLDYRQQAESRREAASSGPTMPTTVVPVRYRVEGSIGENGQVHTRVVLEVANRGVDPVSELAFTLNPDLRVSRAEAGAAGAAGTVQVRRRWDRLLLQLDPPLPPGRSRSLELELAGRPGRRAFALGGWIGADRGGLASADFAESFGRPGSGFRHPALGRSYRVPALSRTRLALAARDLVPVPRYGATGAGALPEVLDPTGAAVSPEPIRPVAELEIDLAVPADLLVADACGALVPGSGDVGGRENAGDGQRLRSRCRLAPSEYVVVGGRYETVSVGDGGPVVAALPHHREQARLHLASLGREAALGAEPWPGLPGVASRIIVEWPDPAVHRSGSYLSQVWDPLDEHDPRAATTHGRLLLLSERRLVSREPLEMAPFLARTVAGELLGRRSVPAGEEEVFRRLYQELARLRMGLTPRAGAVVPWFPRGPGPVLLPLLEAAPDRRIYWQIRFPALVAALQERAGPAAVLEAVERFTARSGTGSLAELLAEVEAVAGKDALGTFVEDFVEDGALPDVSLADVTLEDVGPTHSGRREGRWRIEGTVVNRGGGEAVCRVEVLTAVGSVGTEVAATAERPGRFRLETRYRPQTVLLDPEELCHRYRPLVPIPIERVDFAGGA